MTPEGVGIRPPERGHRELVKHSLKGGFKMGWVDWDFNCDGEVDDMDTISFIANVIEPIEEEESGYGPSGSYDDWDDWDDSYDIW